MFDVVSFGYGRTFRNYELCRSLFRFERSLRLVSEIGMKLEITTTTFVRKIVVFRISKLRRLGSVIEKFVLTGVVGSKRSLFRNQWKFERSLFPKGYFTNRFRNLSSWRLSVRNSKDRGFGQLFRKLRRNYLVFLKAYWRREFDAVTTITGGCIHGNIVCRLSRNLVLRKVVSKK